MMEDLLKIKFTAHYKLPVPTVNEISVITNAIYFEIEDSNGINLHPEIGTGTAKYENPNNKEVKVIQYELFFKSLPQSFQNGKENCDLIVYTSDNQHFLLNELTNTNKGKGRKRTKAISQMLQTLQDISQVPEINSFLQHYNIKHCCYFNKKIQAPQSIRATNTFRRQSFVLSHGSKMSNPDIESYNFELWEFSGNQTYLFS
jgi:hypothetical protein